MYFDAIVLCKCLRCLNKSLWLLYRVLKQQSVMPILTFVLPGVIVTIILYTE